GYYGRILSQTVVVMDTLAVRNGNELVAFCFTPQDGNPLLSTVAAMWWYLDPDSVATNLDILRPYILREARRPDGRRPEGGRRGDRGPGQRGRRRSPGRHHPGRGGRPEAQRRRRRRRTRLRGTGAGRGDIAPRLELPRRRLPVRVAAGGRGLA